MREKNGNANAGSARLNQPRRQYRTGILAVHGIGNHKPGATLEGMITPLAAHLTDATSKDLRFSPAPAGGRQLPGRTPPNGVLHITDDRNRNVDVLCAEAHWSRTVVRRRLSFIPWVVKNLAVLLMLLSLPDRRDDAAFAEQPTGFWRGVAEHAARPAATDPATQSLFRAALRLILITLVIASLFFHPASMAVVAVLLLTLSILRSQNILGDVQLAAARPDDREALICQINRSLDWLLYQCDEVVIVAHSQGGYLSYLALERRAARDYQPHRPHGLPVAARPGQVRKFIGVGSGLKPIWMLRQVNTPRLLAASWLVLGATTLSAVAALPALRMVVDFVAHTVRYAASIGAGLLTPVVRFSPDALLGSQQEFAMQQLGRLWTPPWHEVGAPTFAAIFVASATLTLAAAVLIRTDLEKNPWPPLDKPRFPGKWLEVTSPHDTVGRLLFPGLKGARELVEPAFGNPLLDHVTYFQPASPALWDVAEQVALVADGELVKEASVAEDGGRDYLLGRNSRRRRLHVGLTAGSAFVFLIVVLPSERGLAGFWQLGRSAWLLLAIFAGFHVLAIIRTRSDRSYVLRALSALPEGSRLRDALRDVHETPVAWRHGLAAGLFLAWVVTTTTAMLIATPGMRESATSALALSVGLLVMTLFAAAGYPLPAIAVVLYLGWIAFLLHDALMVGDLLGAGVPAAWIPGLLVGPVLLVLALCLGVALAVTPRVSGLWGTRSRPVGTLVRRLARSARVGRAE